jgi:ATP-dependent Clp protease ATP-binding subunit ClpC
MATSAIPVDESSYLAEFLTQSASKELVSVFRAAVKDAQAAGTRTYLANVTARLLDDPTVSERLPPEIRAKARAALVSQMLEFPQDSHGGANFAFKLVALVEPARRLSLDWGATKVSPVGFLVTCLSASVPLDAVSAQTQERLRASGITVEALGAKASPPDARRQDFTYKTLGFGTDISAMARAGFWPACPLVGMDKQIRTLAKLLNSGTGSACIVGEPGVGKSAFIQGFAYHIAMRNRLLIPPTMDSWTVVMVETTDILQGTGGRGDLETRIREMISFFTKNPTVIPFFEEVHRLLDTEDTSAKTVATALKPPMANGMFRCVGCTTDKEYARYIASDEAMNTRFRKILLPEPDHETAAKIIAGSAANLLRGRAREVGVTISPGAVRAAISVTATYQRSDRLPRKAINLLGAAVSEKVFDLDMSSPDSRPSLEVTDIDVARLFSEISGIPVDALDADRPAYYRRLAEQLAGRVKGQSQAIGSVVSWLALHSRGWVDQRRPRGCFLFLGPPGVGKTELAQGLAAEVMRDNGSVVSLNMADYIGEGARNKFMGADPGYVGFGQTPTIYSRVMMRPFSVVVLDEFEKSAPALANPLLSIFDGAGEDSQGRAVDFSQCVFALTSNALVGDPASPLSQALWRRIASWDEMPEDRRQAESDSFDEEIRGALAELGGIWTLPLLDRINRICLFRPLGRDTLMEILAGSIEKRRKLAAGALPSELDDPGVREQILAAATAGEDGASARRLERGLMRWLSARAGVGVS